MSEIRVNNITNRDGSTGTTVAGIPVVDSTSHFVVPTGRTGQRYVDGGENIVRDGLVLHLDAKYSYPSKTGITATTDSLDPDVYTWYDLSGNGNDGELINGVSYSGTNGGSLVFDGVNDYVECGNDASLNFGTGSFSISIWFKRNVNATSNLRLLYKGAQNNDVDQAGFSFFGSDTSITFAVNPSGDRSFATVYNLTTGSWVNVTAVCEKKENGDRLISAYKNGSLGTTSGATDTITSSGSVSNDSINRSLLLGAGKSTATPNLFWDGNIGIVQIYNRALTAAEVLQNYNATKSRYGY
jgi:hypothetical protein